MSYTILLPTWKTTSYLHLPTLRSPRSLTLLSQAEFTDLQIILHTLDFEALEKRAEVSRDLYLLWRAQCLACGRYVIKNCQMKNLQVNVIISSY